MSVKLPTFKNYLPIPYTAQLILLYKKEFGEEIDVLKTKETKNPILSYIQSKKEGKQTEKENEEEEQEQEKEEIEQYTEEFSENNSEEEEEWIEEDSKEEEEEGEWILAPSFLYLRKSFSMDDLKFDPIRFSFNRIGDAPFSRSTFPFDTIWIQSKYIFRCLILF